MAARPYPWYESISGDDLEQGDVLEACPVFQPPEELAAGESLSPIFDFEDRDVIVMTQTCDLVAGREKVGTVVFCPVWLLTVYTKGYLATPKGREEIRRGNVPAYHMLAACELAGFERGVSVVDFRQLFSLPLAFVRKRAALTESRLRLLPPYREHLAQAFARYFMRVGLPVDIPPFR
jgi:hypothetical protein